MIPSSLYPLVTALLSNILAQVLKTVVYYYRTGKWDFHWVIASGGFPSSHSSTVTALSLSIGIQEGFDSAIFAVTTIFSFIVMYDAMGVRRETGEQAKVLNEIVSQWFQMGNKLQSRDPMEQLKEFVGHTPLQVLIGAILGCSIAAMVCNAMHLM